VLSYRQGNLVHHPEFRIMSLMLYEAECSAFSASRRRLLVALRAPLVRARSCASDSAADRRAHTHFLSVRGTNPASDCTINGRSTVRLPSKRKRETNVGNRVDRFLVRPRPRNRRRNRTRLDPGAFAGG